MECDKSSEDNQRRTIACGRRTCPFQFHGCGIVNLACGWPRGKVTKKARIPVDWLRLSALIQWIRFRETGFHELFELW